MSALRRLRRSPIFIAFARKRTISSVGAASKSRANTQCHSWFDVAPAELMHCGRGFYKDVGPTGLRSGSPRKIWVVLGSCRRRSNSFALYDAPPLTSAPRSHCAIDDKREIGSRTASAFGAVARFSSITAINRFKPMGLEKAGHPAISAEWLSFSTTVAVRYTTGV